MGVAAWLGWWRQTWPLGGAVAVGVPVWLSTGVLLKWQAAETGTWFFIGDPLVALGCLTALVWRRRFPLAIALTVTIASTSSSLATGAALVALCSVSTRRRPVEIGVVVLAFVIASQVAVELYPIPSSADSSLWWQLAFFILTAGIAVASGMAVGARRVEVRSLRDRAESMEREQDARAAQVRALERNRIAREMHDVLAHRISLVAVQAGVLDHREDLSADQERALIRGITEGSHQALEELRDVLGVLRANSGQQPATHPSFEKIPALVTDARDSGLDVTFTTTVTGAPSDVVGRTCYRVVQEGLTNAAKHAPGAHIQITVHGTVGDGLEVSVRNSSATTTMTTRPPASGFGLLGLIERVDLAGGNLSHHPTPDNGYILAAQLPWPYPIPEKSV